MADRIAPSDRTKVRVGNYAADVDTTNMSPEDKDFFQPQIVKKPPLAGIEQKIAIKSKRVQNIRLQKKKAGQ